MDKSAKAPKERDELLSGLILKKYIANARNLSDWYIFEEQKENGNYHRILDRKNAMISWYLSDYCYAAERFKTFLADPEIGQYVAGSDQELMKKRLERFEELERLAPPVDCPDERLRNILHRLRYVYSAVNRPVRVYIADSEADYNAFYQARFAGDVYPYNFFLAVSLYGDRDAYWMVFKKENLEKSDHDVLLGTCAHEMAHLDINSKGTIAGSFQTVGTYQTGDMMVNERMTDLYAMAHGFAYYLYKSRRFWGSSPYVFSAEEIKSYILNIEKITVK